MKKQEILHKIDNELLEKVMGFSYARTKDSHEAQELCSDIIYELVKTADKEGEINDFHAFVYRVAKNVYADFYEKRKRMSLRCYQGNPWEVMTQCH